MSSKRKKLRFNVGGKIFETTATTLSNAGPDSLLRAMIDDAWSAQYEESGEYFIDRDPACFDVFLRLLRTGELHLPPTIPDALLYREADYYGLLDQIRYAKYVELDGENLKPASSVLGRTLLKDSAMIRASPNGGCSIANGRVFHVYDWMLQELSTMNLDYTRIVGMEWYDSVNILISGQRHSRLEGCYGGSIGLFNPQTAELKHRFKLTQTSSSSYGYQFPNTTTTGDGILAIGSENKLFSCYKEGIGAWDIITGQQTGFLKDYDYNIDFGHSFKLQWLPSLNCLMAAISSPQGNRIRLMDPREKEIVAGRRNHRRQHHLKTGETFVDAVAIEDMRLVSVINACGYFSFLDLRGLGNHRLWCSSDQPISSMLKEREFGRPKLGWHGGKLFCSTDSVVSVYNSTSSEIDWKMVCEFQTKSGGLIHDFSIGGDRFFSLQALSPFKSYEFTVWETPPPPPPRY